MGTEVELADRLLDCLMNFSGDDTFDQRVELQCFFHCEIREKSVVLGHITDQLSSLRKLCLHVQALHCDLSHRRGDIPCQALERGRLACSIDAKKGKALAEVEAKSSLFDCFYRGTAELIVLFLEIAHSDAILILTIMLLRFNTSLLSNDVFISFLLLAAILHIVVTTSTEAKAREPSKVRVNFQLNHR